MWKVGCTARLVPNMRFRGLPVSRALHHLLTLLIASALSLAPVAGAGMMHGEQGADRATPGHCPEMGSGSASDSVVQAEPLACEMPCAVCGTCGVSALPSSMILPFTASLSSPVPGFVAMGPDARAGPDQRPPL